MNDVLGSLVATGRQRLRAIVVGLLLGGTVAAHAAPPVLTLAVADIAFAAPVLIAESEGWFAAEGLKLKVVHCVIGRVCLKRLLDGEAHFATVADTPIVFASFTRKDFSIVANLGSSGREMRMVVRTDRGITNAADLKRRRIGIYKGTTGQYFTDTFLRFNGIDPADVTLVALDIADGFGALQRGEVDAAGLFDPLVGDALRELGGKVRALPSLGFFNVMYNLVSVPAAAGASDEDLVKLLRALKRADDLIRTQPDRAREITASALKADAKRFEEVWNHNDFRLQLAPPLLSSLEAQSRWALREELVPTDARLPDYLNFIRSGPLRRVNPRAVRVAE